MMHNQATMGLHHLPASVRDFLGWAEGVRKKSCVLLYGVARPVTQALLCFRRCVRFGIR